MGDRGSTPPVPGLLTGFVTPTVIPLQVAYFSVANLLTRATFRLTDPPDGGSVTVSLNTASDGSGSGISVVIADGERFATVTGAVAIAAGGALYQRITAESGSAMNLSGEYEVEVSAGVATMLTTLAIVKLDAGISGTDADRDSVLTEWISGVSRQMQDWMSRSIVLSTATGEKIDSDGGISVHTHHYPIVSVASLEEAGTALAEGTDFEFTERDMEIGQIVRISGGDPVAWSRGRRIVTVTYTHGWEAVPASLQQAATAMVTVRYFETVQSGKGWRGLSSKGVEPAASATYDKEIWERDIIPAMTPYRRMFV